MAKYKNINYLQHSLFIIFGVYLYFNSLYSQVNISTGSYYQNFGASNITTWTNNSTFPGWYFGTGTFQGNTPNLVSSPNSYNAGGYYSYNCGSDAKIGSRASGSASTLRYGVVLRNTTGQPIQSVRVNYTGFQMSLAENGSNVNTIAFSYSVATSAPPIGGGGTNYTGLNFTQIQNSTIAGSNQITGYLCTQSVSISACIPVSIANNSYILLRWTDTDDTNNDHHMAIDDVVVEFDLTGNACSILLPLELIDFHLNQDKDVTNLFWQTASEKNTNYFEIEKSLDGLNFEKIGSKKAQGNSYENTNYTFINYQAVDEIAYYRLKMVDVDEQYSYSKIISTNSFVHELPKVYSDANQLIIDNAKESMMYLFDLSGKEILSTEITELRQTIPFNQNITSGVFFVKFIYSNKVLNQKIIISN